MKPSGSDVRQARLSAASASAITSPVLTEQAVTMPTSLHVTPRGDLTGHDTATDDADCACGPVVHPVVQKHGGMGWLVVHNSLDGREQQETPECLS